MLPLSGSHFRGLLFLCTGGRGVDDICICFGRLLDRAFNVFVFVLDAGGSGFDIFALLFEARNARLNVLEGIENYLFFVSSLRCLNILPCFLNRCGYFCERGSLYHDFHGIRFACRVV